MATPKVNSPDLSSLLGTVGHKVEQFTVTLDQISADIRAVEKWLQESGVRIEVEWVYRDSEYVTDVPFDPMDGGPLPARSDTYALAWAPPAEGKPWRILYIARQSEGSWDEGHWYWGETKVVESRPLIETPTTVRLGIGDALEKLVAEIASKIPAYTEETLLEGDLNIIDQSRPKSGTGPWRVSFDLGPDVFSNTPGQVYQSWATVLATVYRLVGPDVPPERLTGHSIMLAKIKASVRILRELELM